MTLTPSDVGTTFTVNSGEAFVRAVEALTNGILDSYSWFFSSGAGGRGGGGPETSLWTANNHQIGDYVYHIEGYYSGWNGIDFEGSTIDHLEFRTDVHDPRHFGFTIELHDSPSTVPIPSTILLLGTGLIGLIGVKRRRSKP